MTIVVISQYCCALLQRGVAQGVLPTPHYAPRFSPTKCTPRGTPTRLVRRRQHCCCNPSFRLSSWGQQQARQSERQGIKVASMKLMLLHRQSRSLLQTNTTMNFVRAICRSQSVHLEFLSQNTLTRRMILTPPPRDRAQFMDRIGASNDEHRRALAALMDELLVDRPKASKNPSMQIELVFDENSCTTSFAVRPLTMENVRLCDRHPVTSDEFGSIQEYGADADVPQQNVSPPAERVPQAPGIMPHLKKKSDC